MLRASEFTGRSFQHLADIEARKGKPDPAALFPEALQIIRDLRTLRAHKRAALRATVDPADRGAIAETFNTERRRLQTLKSEVLREQLSMASLEVTNKIAHGTYTWRLSPGPEIRGKKTFKIDSGDPQIYFAAKQLESSIRRSYYGSGYSRNQIVRQLTIALGDQMPKMLIKTDIAEFFETIPHGLLRANLISTGALSSLGESFFEQFLDEYSSLTSKTAGLPRGVGISSQLAESYLQPLDRKIRASPFVTFYARYVDDIVVVLSTSDTAAASAVKDKITQIVNDMGLSLNTSKTSTLPGAPAGGLIGSFDFLGYSLSVNGKGATVSLPPSKLSKLKKRIDETLAEWLTHPPQSYGHQKLLLDRWRFMTGNTHLSHNKRQAMTGIHFSNPDLTDDSDLKALDAYARMRIGQAAIPEPLRSRLLSLSFETGFHQKTMHRFNQTNLRRITSVWKRDH